jgi:hypothetical protein
MNTVFRIYTEDLNRDEILQLTAKKFDSFTLQPTTGYSKGKPEKSIVLEIVEAKKKDVAAVAEQIRGLNGQKSVLVIRLNGKVKTIER